MALPNFTPSAYATVSATPVSAAFPLPGAGATVLVSNIGPAPAFVLLGPVGALVVTPQTGLAVLPNSSVSLAVGSNTQLAAISAAGGNQAAVLNLAVGT